MTVVNSPILRTSVAILNLALVPIVLPTYLIVIWMYSKNNNFKAVFSYKIMLFGGIFDCFYCFSMGQAGLMTYLKKTLFEGFHMFGAGIQISYLSLAPVLSFLLAVHRLLIVWRIRSVRKMVFKLLIVATCVGAVLIPVGTSATRMQFGYDVAISDTYYYDGKTLYAKIIINFGFAFLVLTLLCYFLIAVSFAYQKINHGHTRNLSKHEVFLILQAFLLFFPFATTRTIVFCCNMAIFSEPALHAGFMLTSSLIPAVNLVVHFVSNSLIRKGFAEITHRKFKAASKLFSVT
ncbi:hypothetical protein QR680_009867 [Steinernema hermaphroditum]|uniref:Uncharacterized protein n=1 Tax=Steinernema hermaphroditum TaxID=289476 RepID=A0AA39ILX5_9BILA|nr:hypothetical protein QR680_009867 [Steinernema hermaphroditum]